MTQAMIFLTVLVTGLGCGVGCGSLSTPFLMARMVGEQRSVRGCVRAALLFLLGKLLMLAVLGASSALLGDLILERVQSLYPGVTKWVFRGLLVAAAGLILYGSLKKKGCGQCGGCKRPWEERLLSASYPAAGAVYAAIPCAPLASTLTYAAGMTLPAAVLLLVCFGISNSLFPVLLYAPITGVAVERLREEAPRLQKSLKVASALALLGMTAAV